MADDSAALLDRLLARHGGIDCFSPAQLNAARALAVLLAADQPDPVSARTACELERLLPELPSEDEPEPDYSLLSDRELELLDHLMEVALGHRERGSLVPDPAKVEHSSRWYAATDAAALMDGIAPHLEPFHGELSETQRLKLMGWLGSLMYPFHPEHIWPWLRSEEAASGAGAAAHASASSEATAATANVPAPPATSPATAPGRAQGVPGAPYVTPEAEVVSLDREERRRANRAAAEAAAPIVNADIGSRYAGVGVREGGGGTKWQEGDLPSRR